ncbi:hypothetical protein TARUN_3083 [Trichoderma arundinaceum]|uniref:Uncharacterized protein n=1 Tax=Trichoderma arundinaceum TaxID=490622 RepID=A0A395NT53_TRIAR|nr:hypothetical protein TARUN_3083 [Trichoderma arundinaceum]
MAPSQKRPIEDDFIHTLSDNDEEALQEEQLVAQPPKKKVKTNKKLAKKNKDEDEEPQAEENEGVWGQKDENDGAMDSDFEFMLDDAGEVGDEEFEGWGFEGAKNGMAVEKVGVDLDEIIRRRREKKNQKAGKDVEAVEEEQDSADGGADIDMDDDEDEVLADDAFGMNVDSDAEDSGDDADAKNGEDDDGDDDDDDEAASDNDSVATPVNHPDDMSDDDEEDPEEKAKRDAFFAPEEKQQPGKKVDVSSFQAMSLSRPILRGLTAVGFSKPTPIQAKTIPIALMGKDLVGGAVTGSGKTAAFVLPILERLLYRPKKIPTTRVVILTPTRELAIQCHAVATKLAAHTDIKFTLAVGGLSLKVQESELRLRPDVIIATPGRFIDHMRNSASFSVDTVEILVLDEADRMLEDGFADELNEILTTLPKSRQTMLFSATMTSTVDRLIKVGLNKPARVMVDSQKKTAGTLIQEFVRLRPGREEKRMGYLVHICKNLYTERVIIFFRQKKDAHRARIVFGLLGLSCAELHGSMNQTQRIASVESFRDGKVSYLLATDLASRGLDIKGVDTVINYEAPQSVEIYVHRVGRTARAGRNGISVTLAAEPDRKVVKAAVKAGKAQGSKIISRIIEAKEADQWQAEIDEMDDEIEEIEKEEKEERQLAQVEMQIKKGENVIRHEAEIKSRPKRTWFETQHDKDKAKQAGRNELNGPRGANKKAGTGKLSNKDKKRLDAKAQRSEGKEWKKGKTAATSAVGKGVKKAPVKGKAKVQMKKPKGRSKLAPFRILFGLGRTRTPHRHNQGLARYLLPHTVRDRYRERLFNFHLDTLPRLKHRIQSRIYRYILGRQSRRRTKTRVVDLVARQSQRLLLGHPGRRPTKHVTGRPATSLRQLKMPPPGDMGYAPRMNDMSRTPTMGDGAERGERGYRRKKFAAMAGAMAGNIYRTGQMAVTEIRETYAQSRARGLDGEFDLAGSMHIPGAFPDVAITAQGSGEQLVMFPSYAKQHTKKEWAQPSAYDQEAGSLQDEDYWRSEWEKHQDERAIVDVDVRGWIYSPHTGPMTRRNRILIGLARQLSGIPVPRADQNQGPAPPSMNEELREQEKIAQEAAMIERRGQEEKRIANSGAYSEQPREDTSFGGPAYPLPRPLPPRGDSRTPDSTSGSPKLPTRQNSALANELTDAELATANANLMARIAPFMTNPLVALPITIFFYNESKSQSRSVLTDDAGHFAIRAPLDFVPTHIRVLVNEGLSTTQEVKYIEPYGVSLISDIDDTVKMSNISAGAREIFRNTFVRELADLTIDGVREWYGKMQSLGVSVHYCSNSPWQLFPMLATFFRISGLPLGSLHLKQYSGMLQGIFEPVAERKKNTLVRLLRDFPSRKFLLVGDSGEADLEVYTELALAYPGRILAVFIRDVTTPETAGYFEPSFEMTRRTMSGLTLNNNSAASGRQAARQNSSPGPVGHAKPPAGPVMGTLIDFSDEPEEAKLDDAAALEQIRMSRPGPSASAADLLARKPPPPPRPAKPAALASAPSVPTARKGSVGLGISGASSNTGPEPPPKPPRKPVGQSGANQPVHPLAQIQNSSQQTVESAKTTAREESRADKPPPPPPRRSTKNLSPRMVSYGRGASSNSDVDFDPLPPSLAPVPAATGLSFYRPNSRSGNTSPSGSPTMGAVNKKLELWRRRLARAHDQLDQLGVALYTWRKGQDVEAEAVGIIKRHLAEMEKEARTRRT